MESSFAVSISILAAAVNVGVYIATIRFHGKRLNELEQSQQKQDETISKHGERIARIEGPLKANGAAHRL